MLTCILKVTEDCNLSCKYCYVPENSPKGILSSETLEESLKQVLRTEDERVDFIWHGGEPLLSGAELYLDGMEYMEEYNENDAIIKNKIQTNGTLIKDEHVDLFEDYDFGVGISLDGPKEIQDYQRIHPNGRGSYEEVMNGINKLKEREVDFGILSVLTRKGLGKEKEIYEEIKSHTDHGKLNFFLPEGHGRKYEDRLGIDNKDFFKLFRNFYELWKNEENTDFRLSPLVEIVTSFVSENNDRKNSLCAFNNSCLSNGYISVSPHGDVYPCGRVSGIERYKLGNVNEKENLIERIRREDLPEMNRKRNDSIESSCGDCNYLEICYGGCAHDSQYEYEDLIHSTPYCKGRKDLFRHIEGDMRSD